MVTPSFSQTNLVTGKTYCIEVEAVTQCGTSPKSAPLCMTAGYCADPPIVQYNSVREYDDNRQGNAVCRWTPGNLNGFGLTGYAVRIQHADGQYLDAQQYCLERTNNFNFNFDETQCTIPLSILRTTFQLDETAEIRCQVETYNEYSERVRNIPNLYCVRPGESIIGYMPILAVAPSPPILRFVTKSCGSTTVQCLPNINDGGAEVFEYRFLYQETGLAAGN